MLSTQNEEENSESSRLKSVLAEAEERFKDETEAIKELLESQLSQANVEVWVNPDWPTEWLTNKCDKQRDANKSLQSDLHAATSNATKELQTKDKRILRLETKVCLPAGSYAMSTDQLPGTIITGRASIPSPGVFKSATAD